MVKLIYIDIFNKWKILSVILILQSYSYILSLNLALPLYLSFNKSFCLTLMCLYIVWKPEELWTFPLPPSLLGLSLSTPITLFSETPVWCSYFRLWSHSCSFHFCNFISCQQGLGMWYYCTHTGWNSCEKAFLFLCPAGCCSAWRWWSVHVCWGGWFTVEQCGNNILHKIKNFLGYKHKALIWFCHSFNLSWLFSCQCCSATLSGFT